MSGEYEAMYFSAFREWLKTVTAHIIMEHEQDVIPKGVYDKLTKSVEEVNKIKPKFQQVSN